MLAVHCATTGGPEVLRLEQTVCPTAEAGEVLIEVMAAGINGPDVAQRKGIYPPPAGASPLLGLEVSGRVVALGSGISRLKIGDKVVALVNGGGYAEYVSAPEGQVLPRPKGWTWAQAATLPETCFTIQQAMISPLPTLQGLHVLVHGGSGGLGATAIQMAKLGGATVSTTVSSEQKGQYAASMGADVVIDRTCEDFVAKVRDYTSGRGADVVLDIVGGSAISANVAVAAHGGRLVLLAVQGGAKGEINLGSVLMKNLAICGSTLRPQSAESKATIARSLAHGVWPAIEAGTYRPPALTQFDMEAAADAHRHLQDPGRVGRLVLITPTGRSTSD